MTRGRPGIRPLVSAYVERHPEGVTAGAIASYLNEPLERVRKCLMSWRRTEPRLDPQIVDKQLIWRLLPEPAAPVARALTLPVEPLGPRDRARVALGVPADPLTMDNPELVPRLAGDALLFAHVDARRVVALREAAERVQARSFAAALGASAPVEAILRVANWLLDDIRDGMVPARIWFIPEPKQEESKDA